MSEPILSTKDLDSCIATLRECLAALEEAETDSRLFRLARTACVGNFEVALEVANKLLRKRLEDYYATPKLAASLSFKDVFRFAAKHGIISLESTRRWVKYRDARNNTSHEYGLAHLDEIIGLLTTFIRDVEEVSKAINDANSGTD